MADGLKGWADMVRRVDDHDTRIKRLETNDERQDKELAGLNADVALLANIAHRATARGAAAAKRARRKGPAR